MTELRNLRKFQGMSLGELAFRSGIDEGLLSKAERGWKRIPEETRKRVAEVLGVRETQLFEESGYARKN